MAKSKRVRYSGVGVFANQWLLSRVQTVSADTDLSEEEVRELTNQEVVEYAAQTPSVTISLDTNEYGSMRNIRSVCNVTGYTAIDVNTFDGLSTDVAVVIEEDNIIARTMHVNDAFVTSVSWSFDVGGIATESITFEADNKNWYLNTYKQAYVYTSIPMTSWPAPSGEYADSGYFWIDTSNSTIIDSGQGLIDDFTEIKGYVDGVQTPSIELIASSSTGPGSGWIFDPNFVFCVWPHTATEAASGTRHRMVAYKDTSDTTIPEVTDTGSIGGITRGMIDLFMTSGEELDPVGGFGAVGTTNFLRLQSLSVDADLSREVLEELGHYRAYDRSLTFPVPVNLTFNALSSDLEEWAKLQNNAWHTAGNELGIAAFAKTAALQVRICDKKDTETNRSILKTLTISGIQVVSESFGIDVGGNATQDYTAKASNFLLSGDGLPA